MTSWRMDLTVLTDLASSMFAASFMILLIFLSLEQQNTRTPTATARAIEGAQAFRIVTRPVLTPGDIVDLLRMHGHSTPGLGIDIFEDRVEITASGSGLGRQALTPKTLDAGLLQAVDEIGDHPIRLYVFSNRLYNRVAWALEAQPSPVLEMTVPRALRDTSRPGMGWSRAFLQLDARQLDRETFRQRLAVLLGGEEGGAAARRKGAAFTISAEQAPGPPIVGANLLDRIEAWLGHIFAYGMPVLGLAIVGWIERHRFMPHQGRERRF